jgi:hypothetical protein
MEVMVGGLGMVDGMIFGNASVLIKIDTYIP